MQQIGRADPAHTFAGGAGETFVDGVVHAVIGLADPGMEIRFVATDDVDAAVGRSAVDNDVIKIWVILAKDRANGRVEVAGRVEDGRDEGNGRPRLTVRAGISGGLGRRRARHGKECTAPLLGQQRNQFRVVEFLARSDKHAAQIVTVAGAVEIVLPFEAEVFVNRRSDRRVDVRETDATQADTT